MWKVLIVEDEVFVRESIREIIRWEELGFTVVGEAGTGKQALAMIRELEPDLVLTDIVMPEMDGLELLKRAREGGHDCKFVMLTCMNEFHYAREALEFGASNYILKLSMSVQSLSETLEKIAKELEKDRKYREFERTRYYQCLWDAMTGLRAPEPDGGAPLPVRGGWERHCRIVAMLDGRSAGTDRDGFVLGLPTRPDQCTVHHFSSHGVTFAFLWSREPLELRPDPPPTDFTWLVSPDLAGDRLPECWRAMMKRVDRCWYEETAEHGMPDGRAFGWTEEAESEEIRAFFWEEEVAFFHQFEQLKWADCRAMIDRLWETMRSCRLGMVMAKEMVVEIERKLRRLAKAPSGEPRDLLLAPDAAELKRLFLERAERLLNFRIHSQTRWTDHPEINKVKAFILQHYNTPITVKSLAKYVALDETYLSNLFKQKTGETLIKFLHRVRVEKSIQFLERTDLPISEIAFLTGFVHINYFNRIFKRMVGLTPSEYRTKHRQTKNAISQTELLCKRDP